MSHSAVFVLSTGRCGTQWLAKELGEAYASQAVVTHEPVHAAYRPKQFLRHARPAELLEFDEVSRHVEFIEKVLEKQSYVETGWPCYPAVPMLLERFAGRIKLVHLVREPVRTALSLATHQVYQKAGWVADAAIAPSDPGVVGRELAGVWDGLNEYEKCLFWWTEVNLYALELEERHPDVPYRRVRYEDLFSDGPALGELLGFMGFDPAAFGAERTQRVVDRFQWKNAAFDWKAIEKYPKTLALARRFGYEPERIEAAELSRRYFTGVRGSLLRLFERVRSSVRR